MSTRILDVVTTVDPKAGGVAESIRTRGEMLASLGHVQHVASLDDPDASHVASYPQTIFALGNGITHWKYQPKLDHFLRENIAKYNAVIVDGIWQYPAFAVRRAALNASIPYFVYPHGMLDPWFNQSNRAKHVKKLLFWFWSERRVLRDAERVLFTCTEEMRLAAGSFPRFQCKGEVVSFGAASPPDVTSEIDCVPLLRDLKNERIILFLGRITPKKGCDLIVEAAAKMTLPADLSFVFAGPADLAYEEYLRRRIAALGLTSRFHWLGMLDSMRRWSALRACDAFILPSHQENFGLAAAEAMACGRAVLVSNKVNIWREIQDGGAGYVEADTIEGTKRLLERWLGTPSKERTRMNQQARDLFNRKFSAHSMAKDLLRIIST